MSENAILNKRIKKLQETSQRKSSLHIDIDNTSLENPPELNRNNDNDIETVVDNNNMDDENKDKTATTPTNRVKKRGRRAGQNCTFTAFFGTKSPNSKKQKGDIKEKMKIVEDPSEDPTYEAETIALSGIQQNIKDEFVNDKLINELIEKFSPIIRNFPEQIKNEMIECSENWENRNEIFIGAINYVKHGRKDSHEREETLEGECRESLCELLIREIENRMPKYCRTCKQYYIVKLNNCPEIHCMWCGVGMHDCISMREIRDMEGIKWLCETCEPVFNTHYIHKLDPIAIFEGFNQHKIKSPKKK